jgi:hypothetical protein
MAIIYHRKAEARERRALEQQNKREIRAGRPALIVTARKEEKR